MYRRRHTHAALAMCMAALALSINGCGSSDALTVSGKVSLDGCPSVAELLIEPLNESGKRQGQSVTVSSQTDGRFHAVVPAESGSSTQLPCRISVRIPRSSKQVSSAFDYDALPDKVVELRRDLSPNRELTLLITL